MDTDVLLTLLGVTGTLLGTVLGWGLNELSQKGRLFVYVNKWREEYQKQDDCGGFIECNSCEAEYYNFSLSIDVYNSSNETHIMRDITIVYFDNKKRRLFELVPKDDSTKRVGFSPVPNYDEIAVANISAKSALNINLHNGMNNSDPNWRALSESAQIMLEYLNEKNKRKAILLYKR
ncbi:hypothetical protein [Butyrivibrio sp. WCE2006]|uniref:hypothetical protein n=1 Tax=Butyrivibrio sp. WCE2006 TaxID=1410611 RepID=UPI0005D1D798|nr:hypothetical protein [Butyrivibrio sp. WCE2006]